ALGLAHSLQVARALQKIDHPNIVSVLDVFESRGTAYVLMGYERGETVAGRFARGSLRKL
ncbi:MAG: hypothetical protein ACT4NU_01330, partial [Chromatiales bacterium]